jgi:aspartate-semialdehyde dehydrogenase
MPEKVKGMILLDGEKDIEALAERVDLVFCAVDMEKERLRALEEAYAKRECPVMSNNSAHRWTPDVPMIIPELNPEHAEVIRRQRRRLGTENGFIATKSNCSLQSYLPALWPLHRRYGLTKALACTYQAISGAGKTFATWPEMLDNVQPLIKGEEEKSEREPLKIWGAVTDEGIMPAAGPSITAQCLRVPVSDGHMAAVFAAFERQPDLGEIRQIWADFAGLPQKLGLPSAPKQFLRYFSEEDRPQTRLDRELEGGMAVSIGRLRPDSQYDIKFVCLSHNTLRGAAGGNVLMAELLCHQGYIRRRAEN